MTEVKKVVSEVQQRVEDIDIAAENGNADDVADGFFRLDLAVEELRRLCGDGG